MLISSSWREVHPFDELRLFFAESLQARIVGVTPVHEKVFGKQWTRSEADIAATRCQRQFEIERWVTETVATGEPWVALDDDPTLFEPRCKHLIVCDSKVGLTQERLELVDACFKQQCSDPQKRVNVVSSAEVGRRSVPRLSEGQQALWSGLNANRGAFAVDAVAADFKKRQTATLETTAVALVRLEEIDMLSLEEAALITGVPPGTLEGWVMRGRLLGLRHQQLGFRLPRWQFEQPLLEAIPSLFKALGAMQSWVLLNWLETPLGSLDGRTPRMAIEQGDLARVLKLAKFDD